MCGVLPLGLTYQQRKKFLSDAKYYVWEEPLLYNLCRDGIDGRCLFEDEVHSALHYCYASTYGGPFRLDRIITKVLQVGFYWPTFFKDARKFIMSRDWCQRTRNISKRHEISQSGILEVELFDVWGIDFVGPFPHFHSNLCILLQPIISSSGGKPLPPLVITLRWLLSS